MKAKFLVDLVASLGRSAVKNGPTVLTVIAAGGVITTAYLTGRASVNFSRTLEKNHYESESEPTTKEVIKMAVPIFTPPVIMGAATVACIFGAHSISLKRQAALATAYALANDSRKEFEEKAKEIVGKGKVGKIKDEIAKDRLLKDPYSEDNVITTGNGDVLFYDYPSKRYFKSDVQSIRKAENDLNKRIISGGDDFARLNDLYFELGLPQIKLADQYGWSVQYGEPLEIQISTQMTENGIPCGVIDYELDFTFDTK